MSEKAIENNKVSVIGEIISGFTFSHEVFGEGFYLVNVAVSRLSGLYQDEPDIPGRIYLQSAGLPENAAGP